MENPSKHCVWWQGGRGKGMARGWWGCLLLILRGTDTSMELEAAAFLPHPSCCAQWRGMQMDLQLLFFFFTFNEQAKLGAAE